MFFGCVVDGEVVFLCFSKPVERGGKGWRIVFRRGESCFVSCLFVYLF